MSNIKVRFITDYVCPYCYVAKKIFLDAAADYDVDIQWINCESTKTTEAQVDTFHDMAKKRQYKKEISPYVKKYKIPVKLPPAVVPRPYTHKAALGGLLADESGKREVYDQAVTDAYFLKEKDIGKEEILADLAESAGLEREAFLEALHSEQFEQKYEQQTDAILKEIQPETLPTILIGDSVRLEGGIYTLEKYRQFLERARKKLDASLISIEEPVYYRDGSTEKDFEEMKIVKGQGCSIDGCY